jgi:microcin C transport system permease protein
MTLFKLRNPIAIKRWRRFREKKRAYAAMWILLVLYGVSLVSELVCNDRPLYLRCEGRSYFPVFCYYPEDAFLHNGVQTRADYMKLAADARFQAKSGNWMIFPIVQASPYASISPESLAAGNAVTVSLLAASRAASVDLRPDLTIVSSLGSTEFFGAGGGELRGRNLTEWWMVPDDLVPAIRQRAANQACNARLFDLSCASNASVRAHASLSPFTPRKAAPATARLTLRDPEAGRTARRTLEFERSAARPRGSASFWNALPAETQAALAKLARTAFDGTAAPISVNIAGRPWVAEAIKDTVAWPHPPVRGHWLGVDSAGRDVFARILYGLRTSLTFGLLLVLAAEFFGIIVGSIQGYYAGRVDITAQRLIEIWSALPFLYVMILLGSVYGRSFGLLLLCYGLFNWIGISYYMRAEFLRLRNMPFVDAARCLGVPARRIIFSHILPNALTPIVTLIPFSLVGAIGSLASLDYLGFGLPPPTPSWGDLLQQAQQFRWAWWLILYPSLMLFTVMLLGVFLGEGIRDAFDPRRFSRLE